MSLLIFSKTSGYRHDSIPHAVAALLRSARRSGLDADATEDAADLVRALPRVRAVIWLSTSGDVLDAAARVAFEAFIARGGGYVGIHAASATELAWPFYTRLVGARFTGHPELQPARLVIEDHQHPATAHLGQFWERSDEWYEFDANPRGRVRVLISVDEGSYRGGAMGDHPIAWCQELGASRSFYTALGHRAEDFDDAAFMRHVEGGIEWVLCASQP